MEMESSIAANGDESRSIEVFEPVGNGDVWMSSISWNDNNDMQVLEMQGIFSTSKDESSPPKAIDFGLSDYVKPESGIFRDVLKADPSFDEDPWPSLSSELAHFLLHLTTKGKWCFKGSFCISTVIYLSRRGYFNIATQRAPELQKYNLHASKSNISSPLLNFAEVRSSVAILVRYLKELPGYKLAQLFMNLLLSTAETAKCRHGNIVHDEYSEILQVDEENHKSIVDIFSIHSENEIGPAYQNMSYTDADESCS
ncbi:unnamed protein product [Fraxinus pennsylvanica]|uniref:Uncharacterized protein n=1 Tax=Fraxinus pennsylvanica TaxID=56036 RepID=A0AAD1ZZF7_9LAMI|nr:unnamed protein product [Fraxinus pennsylvanica]